jgi:hypothetical protein
MLCQLPKHVQVHPAQGQWTASVPHDQIVQCKWSNPLPRCGTNLAVSALYRRDVICGFQKERLVGGRWKSQISAGATCDRLVEPHLLHKRHMLDQTQERGAGRNQRAPGLLLSQTVETIVEQGPVLIEEHMELIAKARAERSRLRRTRRCHAGSLSTQVTPSRKAQRTHALSPDHGRGWSNNLAMPYNSVA